MPPYLFVLVSTKSKRVELAYAHPSVLGHHFALPILDNKYALHICIVYLLINVLRINILKQFFSLKKC